MSKPLSELLDSIEHSPMCDYDGCADDCDCGVSEMERRLRELDERHQMSEYDTKACVCGCGVIPCPDREILDGKR